MSNQSGLFPHRTTRWNLPQFGGSQPSGTQTVTQKSDPWAGQQPYLTDVFSQAKSLYNGNGPSYFPSTTVAPMNSGQTGALDQMYSTGMQGGTPGLAAASGNNASTLNGDFLNAGNPYFSQMADTVMGKVMPGIQAGFNNSGRLDSGLASRAAAQGATDALGGLAYQNYSDERNNQLKAQGIAPSIDQGVQGNQQMALGAAGAYQNQNQNQLNDLVNAWNFNQNQPYQKLGMYSQAVQGNYGGTSQTQQPMYSNPTANLMSAGLGLGALGLMGSQAGLFSGLGSLFAPTWAGGLTAAGGLALSDRRAKENIERIGKAKNGLPIYAYNYKGGDTTHIGFMADEVEKKHPDAVEDIGGLKAVNYAKAVV